MTFTSKIDQLEAIHGSLNYLDDSASYPLAQAETHGKLKTTNGNGSVLTAAPTTFTDSVNSPFTAQSIGDFIRIASGANAGTYRITTFIDTSNVTLASASFTDESSIGYEIRQAQNAEDDYNYLRTSEKDIKGTTNWFDLVPTYTDPKNTGTPKAANLSNLAGNTTDAQVLLYPKEVEAQSVAATNAEITVADTTQYADSADNTGIPVADAGELDETNFSSTIVELIDPETGGVIKAGGSGAVVFGRLFKGIELTNIKIKFFTGNNDATATSYTWQASDPTSINVTYSQRFTFTDLPEDALRKRFILGLNENAETAQDIDDLQSFSGGADGETAPTWTNTAAAYLLQANPNNLEAAINDINNGVGDRQYTALANNVIGDGETITLSLNKLAEKLSDTDVEKITEVITSTIQKETAHTLPGSKSYTLDGGNNGLYMDVILNQGFLTADKATQTVDYDETSTTSVTFHGNINARSLSFLTL